MGPSRRRRTPGFGGRGGRGGKGQRFSDGRGDPTGAKRRPAAVRRRIERRRGGGGFGAYLGDVKAQISLGGRYERRPLVGLDFKAPECHGVAREVSCRRRRRRRKMAKARPRKASEVVSLPRPPRLQASSFGPDVRARHTPRRSHVTDREDGCTASGHGRDYGGADAPSATRDGDARRSRRRAPSGVPRLDLRR